MSQMTIVFSDGSEGAEGEKPVAIKHIQNFSLPDGSAEENLVVDPVFTSCVTANLYGRVMTLVEATCDPTKLKAVKDVFSKELRVWEDDVYKSARERAEGKSFSSNNLYM
jgi:hypothetical protein